MVTLTQAEYTKKVRRQKDATPVLATGLLPDIAPQPVTLTLNTGKKSKYFTGAFQFTADQVAAVKAELTKSVNPPSRSTCA